MSLYNKTKNEIVQYFEVNYSINQELKDKIIKECIDGEVLFEMSDKDFKGLNLNFFDIQKIKNKNQEEKKILKEKSENQLIQKLISLGIEDPIDYIFSNNNQKDINFGTRVLLQKLNKKLSEIISKNKKKKKYLIF